MASRQEAKEPNDHPDLLTRYFRELEKDFKKSMENMGEMHQRLAGQAHQKADNLKEEFKRRPRNVAFNDKSNAGKNSVSLDLKGYDPETIEVKVNDRKVVVSAEHESNYKDSKGKMKYNSKSFFYQVSLPEDVDEEQIRWSLNSNNVLKIEYSP